MIQSVVRAFNILETISNGDQNGLGLVEIARTLGLEKSTVYNLIKTLLAQGYVDQDCSGGKYRLGAKLLELSQGKLGDDYLNEILMPLCHELQQIIQENVSLVAYRAGVLKVICRVMCDNELVVAPNNVKPLYSTVTGRCLLAQVADDQLDNIVDVMGMPGSAWENIDDIEVLRSELQRIRDDGKLIFQSTKRQLGGVGYIIDAPDAFGPLAIGSAMPLFRFEQKRDLLISTIASYSKKMAALLSESTR
jgi:DNA-binding IclR family transcriptional regulator